jgi:hypothetical protein
MSIVFISYLFQNVKVLDNHENSSYHSFKSTYPHPILYQPEILRQKVIDTFGFEKFKQTLASLMNSR